MSVKIETKENSRKSEVVYIFDDHLARETSRVPNIGKRGQMVHNLIEAYDLLSSMKCYPAKPASIDDLLTFHSKSYIEFLCSENCASAKANTESGNSSLNCSDDFQKSISFTSQSDELEDEYGLGYDCPTFSNMTEFACRIAGGTLTAVEALLQGEKIAINWLGGWHHAQRDGASGFCYVNDVVIGIQALQKRFKNILYIDLDAHHGDGVENAFSYSKKVMTVSFHNYEPGHFPGTGNVNDTGYGKGKNFAVNVPFKSGVVDYQFIKVFDKVLEKVESVFTADSIVVQCGSDCLAGDPLGNLNLSCRSLGHCVKQILEKDTPVLFLGGGGYNRPNTARCWAYLTSLITGKQISNEIPEHNDFLHYGPDFELDVIPTLRKNENDDNFLSDIITMISDNLAKI